MPAEAVATAGIQVASAEVRPMKRYVVANAMLDYEPSSYTQLASRVNGTVKHVLVEFGVKVKKGKPLALIESAEVGQAKADFLQSWALLDTRNRELKALESAPESIPAGTFRKAVADLRDAQVRVFNTHQQLLNLGFQIRREDLAGKSDKEVLDYLRTLGLAEVPESVLKREDRQTMTANLVPLIAPYKCQVVDRRIAPGEVVSPKKILFAVADLSKLHIEVMVHPEDAGWLKKGQTVIFVPENHQGDRAKGELTHISPEVDEKLRTVHTHGETSNPGGRLRPHTYGTGRILVADHPRAVVVPRSAIQAEGPSPVARTLLGAGVAGSAAASPAPFLPLAGIFADKTASLVFVRLSETAFEARPVWTGLRDGNSVEVFGVRPGEEVVTTGSHVLKSELNKNRIAGDE
jgi:cobalt-zinc-cadmium efflux system membrane fusion protein